MLRVTRPAHGVPLTGIPRAVGLATLVGLLLGAHPAGRQTTPVLTAAQAKDHLGEEATVCGKVVTARYASDARGQPTFLNLDAAYPQAIFTVLMWRDTRARFGQPEVTYQNKVICVTGKITSYRGDPQIVVSDPKQITIGRR